MSLRPVRLSSIFIAIAIIFAGLLLLQMWLDVFQSAFFVKALVTLAIISCVAAFAVLVKSDLDISGQQKKDKYLD